MRAASKRRGIEITSKSRPIRLSDFRDFDLILAMDNQDRGRDGIIISIVVRILINFGLFYFPHVQTYSNCIFMQ